MRLGYGGFTLIEAVLVITLLAILAAAVLIKNPIEKVRLNGATAKIKADIRYARKLAVSSGQRAGIKFDSVGYGIFSNIVTDTLASSTGEPCSTDPSGNFDVDFTAARCSKFTGITLGFTNATVGFDSLGVPVDGATGAALGTQTVTVTGEAGSQSITIEEQTGRISE